MKKTLLVLVPAVLAFLPAPLASAAGATGPQVHRITMAQMRFGPVPTGIKAGDVILWVNEDIVPHTATARGGGFDVVLAAHQTKRMTVRRTGSTDFFCRYHPAMRGTLVVTAR